MNMLPQGDWPELPYEVDFCKKSFSNKIGVQEMWRFWILCEADVGHVLRDFGELTGIVDWNRDRND